MQFNSNSGSHHVVAIPYPGRGHINPIINLCKLTSLKKPDILFTIVVTEEWHGLISSYEIPPNFSFRTIPNVIPSEFGRAKDFQGFFEAVGKNMESPFEVVLDEIIIPVNVIIADTYLEWAVRVGNRRNIPVASFWTMSASVFSIFFHFHLIKKNGHFPVNLSEQGEEQVDYIPGLPRTRLADFPTIFYETGHSKTLQMALNCVSMVSKAQYLLLSSTYELEPQVIDALKLELPFPVLTLGPTIPHFELKRSNLDDHNAPDYIKWLDSQLKDSVLYVSMGSFLSVSSTQMEEITTGILGSNVWCFWVSRDETILSKTDDRRFVVPWCDQLRVLSHPSVGGFWTHCGWNSTLEAVFSGTPVIACPIFWDQIPNCKKIVDEWKIGVRVRRGLEGKSLVTRQEIEQLVANFMKYEKSFEMRRRAKQLKEVCEAETGKGGSSDTNLQLFIDSIIYQKS